MMDQVACLGGKRELIVFYLRALWIIMNNTSFTSLPHSRTQLTRKSLVNMPHRSAPSFAILIISAIFYPVFTPSTSWEMMTSHDMKKASAGKEA